MTASQQMFEDCVQSGAYQAVNDFFVKLSNHKFSQGFYPSSVVV